MLKFAPKYRCGFAFLSRLLNSIRIYSHPDHLDEAVLKLRPLDRYFHFCSNFKRIFFKHRAGLEV